MIDVECYFESLKAQWVNRILQANPECDGWAQLPYWYLEPFDLVGNSLRCNLNTSAGVEYSEIKSLPCFYQELFFCYNKAFATDEFTFRNNIANEYLWGNQYITRNLGKKKKVLYFRNWIKSGIRNIYHLQFTNNGYLDEDFIFNNVRDKRNIVTEIALMKKALLPFKNVLKTLNYTELTPVQYHSSKAFYNNFVTVKTKNSTDPAKNVGKYCSQSNEEELFTLKIIKESEIKLKEYNFKVLHNILPCNRNLYVWRIRGEPGCDICSENQTIKHLLLECCYVNTLWNKVSACFNTKVTFPMMLGTSKELSSLITLLGFLIYKEWLLSSLENKARKTPINLKWYKSEIQLRIDIYKSCKNTKYGNVSTLESFVQYL